MKSAKLIGMLTPLCKSFNLSFACHLIMLYNNGNIRAEVPNPAVDIDLLREILSWTKGGASCDGVIERLRIRTVPSGYAYHNWIDG